MPSGNCWRTTDGDTTRKRELTIHQEVTNNMPDLGLQAQAEQHFSFLVLEMGYKCTVSTPYLVRFESHTGFIELVFDGNRSFELGLLVGKTGSESCGNPPFSIGEILRLCRAPEALQFSLVQVTSKEVLASFVAQLSQMLRRYGAEFIAGNDKRFAELAEQRRREIEIYAQERDLRMARTEAEAAWSRKDYATVVKVYKPLRASLSTSEVGKLEFAEKKLAVP